jgi:SAM-dependent methyltransferase
MEQEIFDLQDKVEGVHWWFTGRRHVLLALASHLLPESGTVLDVGCGTGGNISAFSDRHRRVGVDPTPNAVALAQERHPKVEFVCGVAPGDVSEIVPTADLVLLTDVLEHVEEDGALLEDLATPMKFGAHLLVTVPADPRLWSPQDVSHHHFRRYTRESLVRLWDDQPLDCLLVAPLNRRLYPIVRTIRLLTRFLRRSAGPAGTDLSLPPAPFNRLLHRVFSGEAEKLSRALVGDDPPPGGPGVSLIAILQKNEGEPNSKAGVGA